VGRIVHYRSFGTPNGEYKADCRAAIITEVGAWVTRGGSDPSEEWTDGGERHRSLNQVFEEDACALKIENPTGTFNNVCRFDVPPTAEDGTTTPTPGTWHWPERTPE
jgi:hypothetical protein